MNLSYNKNRGIVLPSAENIVIHSLTDALTDAQNKSFQRPLRWHTEHAGEQVLWHWRQDPTLVYIAPACVMMAFCTQERSTECHTVLWQWRQDPTPVYIATLVFIARAIVEKKIVARSVTLCYGKED